MTGDFVIKLLGLGGYPPMATEFDGQYLVELDARKLPDVRRATKVTPDPAKARRFMSLEHARGYWKQEHGTRPDGKPNRPLTSFTVAFERIAELT